MPHKHTRREKDLSTFDLPPNQVARPLPPTTQSKRNKGPDNKGQNGGKGAKTAPKNNEPKKDLKRKRETAPKDDAPRAFKRLMAYAGGKKTRSGLDNGEIPKAKSKKQQKPGPVAATENETKAAAAEVPKIRPGETMSEFAQRVDQALPLSGLVQKTAKQGKDPLGLKVWRTNKERKMHKLYDEWREEERKIKEKKEEELEEEEERAAEQEEMGVTWKLDMDAKAGGKKKKGKRSKYLGEATEAEEDPWAEIIRKRGETKPKWNETAKAPPELHKLQQNKLLKVGGAAVMVDGVPKAAGSLRRREELREVREDVVTAYRKLMEERRQNKQ